MELESGSFPLLYIPVIWFYSYYLKNRNIKIKILWIIIIIPITFYIAGAVQSSLFRLDRVGRGAYLLLRSPVITGATFQANRCSILISNVHKTYFDLLQSVLPSVQTFTARTRRATSTKSDHTYFSRIPIVRRNFHFAPCPRTVILWRRVPRGCSSEHYNLNY